MALTSFQLEQIERRIAAECFIDDERSAVLALIAEVRRLQRQADAITQAADHMRSQTCASHDLAAIPYADAQCLVCQRDAALAERDVARRELAQAEAVLCNTTPADLIPVLRQIKAAQERRS